MVQVKDCHPNSPKHYYETPCGTRNDCTCSCNEINEMQIICQTILWHTYTPPLRINVDSSLDEARVMCEGIQGVYHHKGVLGASAAP